MTDTKPQIPGVHLKLDGEWYQLPEALPWDTIKWEKHFGISQALALSETPPMMEHLLYNFFLLVQRHPDVSETIRSDFETFVNAISDMEMVEEPEDPQASAAE